MKTSGIHRSAQSHRPARSRLLAGCAALATGAALAYGLSDASSGRAGAPSQVIQVMTAGSGAYAKTVTQVQTTQAPGITGVNSLAAPPPAPAQMLSPAAEIPVSPTLLRYTNGWTVSDGPVQMSVYAGSEPSDPSTGVLVTITNNLGSQSTKVVKLAGTGAVTITAATSATRTATATTPTPTTRATTRAEQLPASALPEARAEAGTLQFTSASGRTGSLNLQTVTASGG